MANEKIKLYARGKGIAQWQIADRLGISEPTLTRLFRTPMDPKMEKLVKDAIDGKDVKYPKRWEK